MIHSEITGTEAADRLAIRELVDAYAHCADRRDAEGQKSLFTEDTHFVVYMEGQGSEATQALDGREALTPVFDDLNRTRRRCTSTARRRSRSTATERRARATAWPTAWSPSRAQVMLAGFIWGHIRQLDCLAVAVVMDVIWTRPGPAGLRDDVIRTSFPGAAPSARTVDGFKPSPLRGRPCA